MSHTASSIKCKHHFLLLQGVIWCCTDVIVFMVGPLILFNLQQTGAVVTASVCLQQPYQCAPLWSHSASLMHHITTTPVPMSPSSPAPGCDLSPRHRQAEFHMTQRESWHETHELPSPAGYSVHLYSMQINESRPSCVYFRWQLEHETGQQKH